MAGVLAVQLLVLLEARRTATAVPAEGARRVRQRRRRIGTAEPTTRTLEGMDDTTAQPQDPASSQATGPDLAAVTVAVIGAGNMGGPVVRAMLAAGARPERLQIVNSSPASSERAAAELGVRAAASRSEALQDADVVVLGVKPYQILDLAGEIGADLSGEAIVVSLAAGTTLAQLEQALPAGQSVERAMPNTPISVGEGAVGLMRGSAVTEAQHALVHALFARAGVAVDITRTRCTPSSARPVRCPASCSCCWRR